MVKQKSFLPILIIAFFLVSVLTLAPSAQAGKLSGDTVKIGGIYSVSGVCAEWGTAAKISAEIAVEEINAAGGIGGVPIEMVWYDVGCKAPPAIPVVEKLAKQDKVLVVNGPCQSSVCEVIFPKLNRLKFLLLQTGSVCSEPLGIQKHPDQR
jgi:branched-chain amino acid transport system substrate-binding protein